MPTTNTIGTYVNHSVTIGNGTYVSPLTITSSGTVSNSGAGDAVYGSASAAYTVLNRGLITASGNYDGVKLQVGGSVDNTGTIAGAAGVYIGGATGTVTNFGIINGTIGAGIVLGQGGFVTNNAHALIQGNTAGVSATAAAATVTNSGTIYGINTGIYLGQGGSIVNNARAIIAGTAAAVSAVDATAAISNNGTLSNYYGVAVTLAAGGSVTNNARGNIFGGVEISNAGGTVVNNNRITSYHADAIRLLAGGTVVNSSIVAGPTTGYWGVYISGGGFVTNGRNGYIYAGVAAYGAQATTIVNSGKIINADAPGIYLQSGSVTNSGTIVTLGYNVYASGIYLASGNVVNSGSGRILGYYGIYATGSANVTNSGTIEGLGLLALYLKLGGKVINTSSGHIVGGNAGVYITGGPGTLVNDGSIASYGFVGAFLGAGGTVTNSGTIGGSNAIVFGGSGNNRLILAAGYKLYGAVQGSTTPGATNTLELGLSASAGTVSGLGSGFLNFGTVTVDSGAQWTLAGTNALAGTVLTDLGTLTNTGTLNIGSGSLVVGPATLVNSGSINGVVTLSGTHATLQNLSTGSISNSLDGVFDALNPGTVVNIGTISSSNRSGIELLKGGYINNNNGGVVSARGSAIRLGQTGTVINAGTAKSTHSGYSAVSLAGGIFTNQSQGYVRGYAGVYSSGSISVVNQGSIKGTAMAGVYLRAGGQVANAGTIDGGSFGVRAIAGGTVDNSATGVINGADGISIVIGYGTLTNAGSVTGSSYGVYMESGGVLSNAATGKISGLNITGVYIRSVGGTVTNAGSIVGFSEGISLYGGLLSNASTGVISGNTGAEIRGGNGTVINAGSIVANNRGVLLEAGGSLSNAFGGVVAGTSNVGVYIARGGGTVTNAGTIIGGVAGAVWFVGNYTDRVIMDPGAVFSGGVIGGSGSNTLELAAGGSAGTIGGIGTQYTNFGTITVDSGATWILAGSNSLGSLTNNGTLEIASGATATGIISFGTGAKLLVEGGSLPTDPSPAIGATLAQLTPGDIITLPNIAFVGGTAAVNASNVLQVTEAGHTYDLQLDQPYAGHTFSLFNDNGGTGIAEDGVACYCRGTLILTPDGEVPVEELATGDLVTVLAGAARPIRWIGRRAYDGRFIAGNRQVLPIRVAAGALGDGMPACDLYVSPGHAVYIPGSGPGTDVLVQAEHLVNGATIVQAEQVDQVEYFHIELDTHDIVIANGAPAETYVDCDNRMMFANGSEYAAHYPEDGRLKWDFCRPRLDADAAGLTPIRAGLLRRAERLGYGFDDGPDLRLVVDGEMIAPVAVEGRIYRFTVPAGGGDARLASRSSVPAEIDAGSRDTRRLGVPVERLVLHDCDTRIEIGHHHTGLCDGFHGAEPTHRWTDGLARFPEALLHPFAGALTLEVHLAPNSLRYRVHRPKAAAAA